MDIKTLYMGAKPGPCPFTGIPFKDVPLYDEGYGCPCCKGLSHHLDIGQREADAYNKKMIDAELAAWEVPMTTMVENNSVQEALARAAEDAPCFSGFPSKEGTDD